MAERPVLLVVVDDPAIRELLSAIFSVNGRFRIGGVAENGLEGAMLAADVQPDVVILDYFMPRWDGCRAAEFIREHCPKSKIIAFSAVLTSPPEWADRFVTKTDIDKLVPMVAQLAAAA